MARVSAVVPTLGRSPWLKDCLETLRAEDEELEIIVVDQGPQPSPAAQELADRVERPAMNLGFAGGTNRGIRVATGELIATVNDDLLVEPGWLAWLREALTGESRVAAVQGINLQMENPERIDGRGIAWNRSWQAVQLDHGRRLDAVATLDGPGEPFGVSATAALYRRSALDAVALQGEHYFDPRLGSYYEDVELAGRLRAAGYRALSVPEARARHAGSVTGGRRPAALRRLIHGNRYLALARLLGRSFPRCLPGALVRDGRDLGRLLLRGRLGEAAGLLAGLARALRLGRHFGHRGAPQVAWDELRSVFAGPAS